MAGLGRDGTCTFTSLRPFNTHYSFYFLCVKLCMGFLQISKNCHLPDIPAYHDQASCKYLPRSCCPTAGTVRHGGTGTCMRVCLCCAYALLWGQWDNSYVEDIYMQTRAMPPLNRLCFVHISGSLVHLTGRVDALLLPAAHSTLANPHSACEKS